ncbi:hypothetical protein JOF53_005953 [Crossiella equi]|uniref:Uncharacterized protein n=1 Tax=Crossiella equi TaxID=130796 RepID=A0ABS5AKY7_9PSEU|nr:hypothetical protein [Crossiella equi]MBP2477081.1 hypothetical protein [Crossiella equi]
MPVDWADPHGPAITLEVARTKAAPVKRPGVLFYGAGGPGGRSTGEVAGVAPRGARRGDPGAV